LAEGENVPALANTFLFLEPLDNSLDYGSVVLQQIVAANRRPGQTIVELAGDEATPDNARAKMLAITPAVLSGVGHGNEQTYTLTNLAVFFDTTPTNLDLVQGMIIDLCSCLTAVSLGPAIMSAGAVAYTGYNTEFWFFIGDPAGSTRAVQSPFLTEFQFVASLLQGKSTGDARTDELAKYDSEIAYWTSGGGKDDPNAADLANIIEMNKSSSVFLGQGTATPSTPTPTVLVAGATPWVWLGMFAVVAYLTYRELKR
jgi:hypothetical protein